MALMYRGRNAPRADVAISRLAGNLVFSFTNQPRSDSPRRSDGTQRSAIHSGPEVVPPPFSETLRRRSNSANSDPPASENKIFRMIATAPNGRALTSAGMVRSTLACGGPSRRPVQRLVRDTLARRGHAAGRRQRPAVRATRKRRANANVKRTQRSARRADGASTLLAALRPTCNVLAASWGPLYHIIRHNHVYFQTISACRSACRTSNLSPSEVIPDHPRLQTQTTSPAAPSPAPSQYHQPSSFPKVPFPQASNPKDDRARFC